MAFLKQDDNKRRREKAKTEMKEAKAAQKKEKAKAAESKRKIREQNGGMGIKIIVFDKLPIEQKSGKNNNKKRK